MSTLITPIQFLDFSINNYPTGNKHENFESYFYNFYTSQNLEHEYTYIPIQWTNYLVKNNYGANLDNLSNFISKNTKKNKKYFTIVQYAGGPLVQLENTKIFSMGGVFNTKVPKGSNVVPLPLIYNTPLNFQNNNNHKLYTASYIGRPTHKIRKKLEKHLRKNPDFYIKNISSMDANISKKNQELFLKKMYESYFSICPRGFGPTSFRLYESIKLGIVPVYVSDEHFLPFEDIIDWSKFSIILKSNKIKKLPKVLNKIIDSGNYLSLLENLKIVSEKYFNYNFMCKYIIK